VNVVKL